MACRPRSTLAVHGQSVCGSRGWRYSGLKAALPRVFPSPLSPRGGQGGKGAGTSGAWITPPAGGGGVPGDRARGLEPGQGAGEAPPPRLVPKFAGATARRNVWFQIHFLMPDASYDQEKAIGVEK